MNARQWGAVSLLNLSQATTTTQGAATDMATYASQAKREMKAVAFVSGLTTITTATVAVTECATTNGTFAAPANGTASAVVTTNGMTELNFRNDLRYVRGEVTVNAAGLANVSIAIVAVKREANS